MIRTAGAADVDAVVALEAATQGEDAWSENLVRDGITGGLPTISYLVAEVDGVVAGYAVASYAGDIAELQRIGVDASVRRRGLATSLLLHLEPLAADTGLELDLRIPEGLDLPAAIEVAAFRTVVEAVTNVARHSGARRACVVLDEHDGSLVVTVSDDGPTRGTWHAGVGLAGMRERAAELGGTLEAGPTPDGGRVRATYPLGAGR